MGDPRTSLMISRNGCKAVKKPLATIFPSGSIATALAPLPVPVGVVAIPVESNVVSRLPSMVYRARA